MAGFFSFIISEITYFAKNKIKNFKINHISAINSLLTKMRIKIIDFVFIRD